MEFFVDVAQVAVGHVGVDLGRADVCMTEEGLDTAQIGAITQKIGGKHMSHCVRSNLFGNASLDRPKFDDPCDRTASQGQIALGFLYCLAVFGKLDK